MSTFRDFGVSAFGRFGVSAFQRFGVSAFWHFGVSACLRVGVILRFSVSLLCISSFVRFDVSAFGVSALRRLNALSFWVQFCIPAGLMRAIGSHFKGFGCNWGHFVDLGVPLGAFCAQSLPKTAGLFQGSPFF